MKPVNLLPEGQRRRRRESSGNRSYVVIGALAVLLLMSAAYVFTANQVTARTDGAAKASAEADRLEARADALGSFGDFAQVKQTRFASVREIAANRFDWERLMRELTRVLPSKGWLQAASASTSPTDDDAAAGNGPSAHLTGCMPRQEDVADMLLRLRRMYRAEDVTLKESVLEDEGGPPSIDSCGRYYKFDVTVAFSADAAEEAPDGQHSVPATLGGGS